MPLAALEAPLLLRCPAVCVALLLLLLLFAVAIALKIDHQLAVVSTRHTGHAATTRAIHDDQHVQVAAHTHSVAGTHSVAVLEFAPSTGNSSTGALLLTARNGVGWRSATYLPPRSYS